MPRGRIANANRAEVRTERIELRATVTEKAEIEKAATKDDRAVGDWLRLLELRTARGAR